MPPPTARYEEDTSTTVVYYPAMIPPKHDGPQKQPGGEDKSAGKLEYESLQRGQQELKYKLQVLDSQLAEVRAAQAERDAEREGTRAASRNATQEEEGTPGKEFMSTTSTITKSLP